MGGDRRKGISAGEQITTTSSSESREKRRDSRGKREGTNE